MIRTINEAGKLAKSTVRGDHAFKFKFHIFHLVFFLTAYLNKFDGEKQHVT